MSDNFRIPIRAIRLINLKGETIYLDGSLISADIYHDINEARVSVDFVEIASMEVDYKIGEVR